MNNNELSEMEQVNRVFNLIKRKISAKEKEEIAKSNMDVTQKELEYIAVINDHKGEQINTALAILDISKST